MTRSLARSAPLPTPTPRRWLAATGCALVLACGSSGSDSATETTNATTDATATETDTAGTETEGAFVCALPGSAVELSACNPLDPSRCALPFPSRFHMRPADTPTGWQLAFADATLPANKSGTPFRPTYLNEKDGFSTIGAMLAYFPDVALTGVVGHQDIAGYQADDVKTVILHAETGARVPHFVELDRSAAKAGERVLILQPVEPLEHGARYVVGIRDLVTDAGDPVAVSPGFSALRDCQASEDADVEGQRARYEADVFPVLEAAGFGRGALQLAWDFVTVSRETSLSRLEWMRDDLLAAIGPGGPAYEIASVEDHDCAASPIARTIIVDMTVPRYTEEDAPNTLLTRGDDGLPYRNGETTVEAMIRVPCSLVAAPKPSRVLQYGHGLLGSYDEAKTGYLSQMADDFGWVILATSWTGMKEQDLPAVLNVMSTDASRFPIIPERSHQGFIEAMAALRMVQGDLASDPSVTFDGVSVIDPETFSYYGNSQGAILGGAYLAASPDHTRGVLGVGGASFRLILTRSADFTPFFDLLKQQYDDHRDIALLIEAFQVTWDPGETGGHLWEMNRAPSPGIPAKDVLMQVGIGDAQVSTLAAHITARAFGASTIAPQTRPIWGVSEREPGFSGSAIVEWRYTDVPDEPVTNTPPEKLTDTHECPRREAAAQAQLREFLEQGVITQHCDGACEGVRAETCP